MHDLSVWEKFRYVARRVLLSPASIALWVIALIVAWLMRGSAIPLGIALLAQIALLYSRLHDEAFLRRLFSERYQREEALTEQQIEALLERMDFETRQRIRYILQLQKEIAREARADDVEGFVQKDLERISAQLLPLVQRAVQVATRKQQLTRYLNHVDERALKSLCANLQQKIQATADPVTKSQYEQALRRREAELQTYQAISQASRRIDSQLENVEATFASWKAKMIRIKTVDVASATAVSQGFYQELESLNSEIDLLDTSVSEALATEEELTLRQNP
jgi:hypothetical protein